MSFDSLQGCEFYLPQQTVAVFGHSHSWNSLNGISCFSLHLLPPAVGTIEQSILLLPSHQMFVLRQDLPRLFSRLHNSNYNLLNFIALDFLHYLHVFLFVGSYELYTALQMWSNLDWIEQEAHSPWAAEQCPSWQSPRHCWPSMLLDAQLVLGQFDVHQHP